MRYLKPLAKVSGFIIIKTHLMVKPTLFGKVKNFYDNFPLPKKITWVVNPIPQTVRVLTRWLFLEKCFVLVIFFLTQKWFFWQNMYGYRFIVKIKFVCWLPLKAVEGGYGTRLVGVRQTENPSECCAQRKFIIPYHYQQPQLLIILSSINLTSNLSQKPRSELVDSTSFVDPFHFSTSILALSLKLRLCSWTFVVVQGTISLSSLYNLISRLSPL